jgi:hypothetical protein
MNDEFSHSKSLQPKVKSLPDQINDIRNYRAGNDNSVVRLRNIGFDPIGELVINYKRLEAEIERQEKWRDGIIGYVPKNANGTPKAYRPEVHHALYVQLGKISESLLRYGYGRVSEITEESKNTQAMPVIINLHSGNKDG